MTASPRPLGRPFVVAVGMLLSLAASAGAQAGARTAAALPRSQADALLEAGR